MTGDKQTKTKTKQATAPAVSDMITNRITDTDNSEMIKTENNDDTYIIYNNSIELLTDDFISTNYPNKSQEELKQDKAFFPLLINYIYNNYLGDYFKNKISYKLKGIKPRYDDINTIDHIFDIYIDLIYKYKFNNRPSITEFSLFTGISKDTIYNWLKGDIDSYILNAMDQDKRKYITCEYADAVRKWQGFCERSLTDGNGVMEIFLLKSVHGFRDQNNTITVEHVMKPVIDADNLPDLIGINSKN